MQISATRRGQTVVLSIDGAEPFYLTLAQAQHLRRQVKAAERLTPSKQRAARAAEPRPPEAS